MLFILESEDVRSPRIGEIIELRDGFDCRTKKPIINEQFMIGVVELRKISDYEFYEIISVIQNVAYSAFEAKKAIIKM